MGSTKEEGKITRFIENLIYNRNLSYALLIMAIGFSIYALSVTQEASLFENADIFKFSIVASGASPYSSFQWLAPYPPLYFILWIIPYLAISSLTNNLAQLYFGFKLFSLIIVYTAAFIIYKSQRSNGKNKYRSISMCALFLGVAQYSLIVLSGDSIGFLLLASGCYFLLKGRDNAGVFFIVLATLFKVQPIFGLLTLLIFFAKVSVRKLTDAFVLVAVTGTILFAVPILTVFSTHSSSFIGFDASNIQLYDFNVYSGVADLAQLVFHVGEVPISQALNYVWIAANITAAAIFTYFMFKTDVFKNARAIDILAVGMLIWIILFKQTLPYYMVWPSIVLISSGRLKSALLLFIGTILGNKFFLEAYVSLGSSTTNYLAPPPITASILFFIGGIIFFIFAVLALRQLIIDIRHQKRNVSFDT